MFSAVWSIGATCDGDSRIKFDKFVRDLLLGKLEEHPVPKMIGKIDIMFPDQGLVYDWMYEVSRFNLMPCLHRATIS